MTNCRSGDDYAGWCFRYYNSFADNHLWLKGVNDFAAETDFFFGNVSFPLLPGALLNGTGLGILTAKTHRFILDPGVSVGLESTGSGFGFGVLLTAGVPLDSQVDNFVTGWGGSAMLNSALGGINLLYSLSSRGWALAFASPLAGGELTVGGSWGICLFHC